MLWGARSVPYLDLGGDYVGVEKNEKIIKLFDEISYTLYALLHVGYLSIKKIRVDFR